MTAHSTPADGDRPAGSLSRYTRTGDDGTTSLGGVGRVAKTDSRLAAEGACEEASAAIGVAVALGTGLSEAVLIALATVQNDLLDVRLDVRSPFDGPGAEPVRIDDAYVMRLERACDHFDDGVVLASFVLPGGTAPASLLHHARTVVRRAERAVWAAVAEHGHTMNPNTGRYLNRLSSLLFVLARAANTEHGDMLWTEGLAPYRTGVELWEMPVPS